MRQIPSVIKADDSDRKQGLLNSLLNAKSWKLSVIKDKLDGKLFVG